MSYINLNAATAEEDTRVRSIPMFGPNAPYMTALVFRPRVIVHTPRPSFEATCESMVSQPCKYTMAPDSCYLGVQAAARGVPLPLDRDPRKQVATLMGFVNYQTSCAIQSEHDVW